MGYGQSRNKKNTTITGFASTTFRKMTSYNSILTISALLLLTLTVCASFPLSSTLKDTSSEESSDLSRDLVGRRYRRGVVIMKPPVRPVLKPFRIRNPYRTSHRRVLPRYPSYRGYGSPTVATGGGSLASTTSTLSTTSSTTSILSTTSTTSSALAEQKKLAEQKRRQDFASAWIDYMDRPRGIVVSKAQARRYQTRNQSYRRSHRRYGSPVRPHLKPFDI